MVRHFLLMVGDPCRGTQLLGRLVSGDESDAPQITTAQDWHVGFEPGPGDNPADAPRRKPDYCLNLGITWPGLLRWKSRIVSQRSRSSLSVRSLPELPNARHWWAIPDRARRRTGSAAFGTGADHVLLTLHAISPQAWRPTATGFPLCSRSVTRFGRSGARTEWR